MDLLRNSTRRLLFLVAVMLVAAASLPTPVAASAQPRTELDRLLSVATAEVGSRYVWAATGPNTFDCSGFVFYAFREAGLLDRIGGKRRTVAEYREWFVNNGKVTKGIASARPGDVLIWGRNKHTGIYLGDNLAVSALVNPFGVKIHKVNKISLNLTAVLHVDLER